MGDATKPLLPGARRGSVNEIAGDSDFKSPVERSMGIIPSMASMLNSVIGTGILALPIAFSRVGYGLGFVLMILCVLISSSSLVVIGMCVTETGATSYGTMMTMVVGKFWGRVTAVVVALQAFGVCIAYSLVIAQNMVDLLDNQGWVTEPIFRGGFGDVIDNRRFWVIVPAVVLVGPLCMLKNYSKLRFASLGATTSMMYLSGLIGLYGIISASRGHLPVWRAGLDACFLDEAGGVCYQAQPGVECAPGPCETLTREVCETDGSLGLWADRLCVVDNEPRPCYQLDEPDCQLLTSGGDASRMGPGDVPGTYNHA